MHKLNLKSKLNIKLVGIVIAHATMKSLIHRYPFIIFILFILIFFSFNNINAQEQFFNSKFCATIPEQNENMCPVNLQNHFAFLLKNIGEVDQGLCRTIVQQDFCKDISARYPFLTNRLIKCENHKNTCPTQEKPIRAVMKNGCHIGVTAAKDQIQQEIAEQIEDADQILAAWNAKFNEIFNHYPTLNWDELKECFSHTEQSSCSIAQLKTYLRDLPTQTKQKLDELLLESEKYKCLDLEGRFAFLCYQAVFKSKNIIQSFSLSGLSNKVVSTIISSNISKTKIIDSALNAKKDKIEPSENNNKIIGLQKLEANLGRKVEIISSKGDSGKYAIFTIKDSLNKNVIGTLDVMYNAKRKTLSIGYIKANNGFQSIGVSETLLQQALKEYPKLEKIYTEELTETNRAIVLEAKQKGLSTIDALKQTPAYKIREKLGFTEIDPASIDEGQFSFEVSKPK